MADDATHAADRFADDYAEHLGIDFADVRPRHAEASLVARGDLLNPKDKLHGSVVYALADVTAAAADEAAGDVTVGLETATSYLAAVDEGETITAVAEQRHTSRKTSLVDVDVKNEEGDLVASFTARGYRVGERTD